MGHFIAIFNKVKLNLPLTYLTLTLKLDFMNPTTSFLLSAIYPVSLKYVGQKQQLFQSHPHGSM